MSKYDFENGVSMAHVRNNVIGAMSDHFDRLDADVVEAEKDITDLTTRMIAAEAAIAGGVGGEGGVGPQGPAGPEGPAGADGEGVPTGGTAGQILAKINGTDFNTGWVDAPAGGSVPEVDMADISVSTLRIDNNVTKQQVLDNYMCLRLSGAGTLAIDLPIPKATVNDATTQIGDGSVREVVSMVAGQKTVLTTAGKFFFIKLDGTLDSNKNHLIVDGCGSVKLQAYGVASHSNWMVLGYSGAVTVSTSMPE